MTDDNVPRTVEKTDEALAFVAEAVAACSVCKILIEAGSAAPVVAVLNEFKRVSGTFGHDLIPRDRLLEALDAFSDCRWDAMSNVWVFPNRRAYQSFVKSVATDFQFSIGSRIEEAGVGRLVMFESGTACIRALDASLVRVAGNGRAFSEEEAHRSIMETYVRAAAGVDVKS